MRQPLFLGFVAVVAAATLAVPGAGPASAAAACGPRITDPLPDEPWPLQRLRPELVWPLTRGDGVLVAVIDSGVSDQHPALAAQVFPGRDLLTNQPDARCDESGHGTIVAGIIAGKQTNNSGFSGIAPGARILPVRVLKDEKRSFDPDDPHRIAQAIRWATDQGARVINLSLVTPNNSDLAAAVSYAQAHDVVVVAAAGNEGTTQLRDQAAYPAAYPGVLAVAGVDENGNHVDTSTPGSYVDVAAPGKEIAGPAPRGNGYGEFSAGGTSFAAAYVSGIAALARAYRPRESAEQIVQRIEQTAEHPAGGWNNEVGYGVVDPYFAVASIGGVGAALTRGGSASVPRPSANPLSDLRAVAAWIALGGLVTAILILVGAWVVRRGRGRGWRPGRAAPLADPGIPRRPEFTPVTGKRLSVTARSSQRPGGGTAAAVPKKVTMPTAGGRRG